MWVVDNNLFLGWFLPDPSCGDLPIDRTAKSDILLKFSNLIALRVPCQPLMYSD